MPIIRENPWPVRCGAYQLPTQGKSEKWRVKYPCAFFIRFRLGQTVGVSRSSNAIDCTRGMPLTLTKVQLT
jgi:hypothetical protein